MLKLYLHLLAYSYLPLLIYDLFILTLNVLFILLYKRGKIDKIWGV